MVNSFLRVERKTCSKMLELASCLNWITFFSLAWTDENSDSLFIQLFLSGSLNGLPESFRVVGPERDPAKCPTHPSILICLQQEILSHFHCLFEEKISKKRSEAARPETIRWSFLSYRIERVNLEVLIQSFPRVEIGNS